MDIILASQSPRRKELLARLVSDFSIQPADVDETPFPKEKPIDYCKRVVRAKAEKIREEHPNALVIAGDTPVICGREIIQSAFTPEEATAMLRKQSGRRVYVVSAICVITPEGKVLEDISKSWVKFKPLTEKEIAWFVAEQENWYGASGAFKIQGSPIEALIKESHGSMSCIMGLPLYETAKLLKRAGVECCQ